jgi:tRNA acetyltransferase TAN1
MEIQAEQELREILCTLGDPLAETLSTSISGLLVCRTQLDPISIPGTLVDLLKEEPWRFKYILRVLPIEKVTEAELNLICRCIKEISARIKPLQTFRITVEKRHNCINSNELIRGIASEIEREVDLSNPDWIILVEVIKNVAGLSIIKPHHIFSSVIEMRKLGGSFIS